MLQNLQLCTLNFTMTTFVFLAVALLQLSAARGDVMGKGKGGCSYMRACHPNIHELVGEGRGEGQSYEECRSQFVSTDKFGALATCLRKAAAETIKNHQCTCTPDEIQQFYYQVVPSTAEYFTTMTCTKFSDALLPGCPEAIRTECVPLRMTMSGPYSSLFDGSCDAKKRAIKLKFSSCAETLQKEDLSKCGSIQNVAKVYLPFMNVMGKFVCSGCNLKAAAANCRLPPSRPNSDCGMVKSIRNSLICFSSAAKKFPSCSGVVSELDEYLDKALEYIPIRNLMESCLAEKQLNYAERYASWGCGAGKPQVPPGPNRTKRTLHPDLDHLYKAIMQFHQL